MKSKIFIFLTITIIAITSQSQIFINAAPVSSEINLNSTSSTIYISNPNINPVNLNLSLLPSQGFSKGADRCSGKTLTKNQSCYFVITVNDSSLPLLDNFAFLQNNGQSITSFKRSKIQSLGVSLFSSSNISLDDFNSKDIVIENKTQLTKSYNPTISGSDASKYEILINRCQNVLSGKSCIISVRLKPQALGNYSALISEPKISGSLSLFSSITSSTVGVTAPLIESILVAPLSLYYGTLTAFGTSSAKTITITNNGTLTISPVITVSSKMSIVLNRCFSLSAGQSCSLSVALKPQVTDVNGLMNEFVSIKSSPLASTISVFASSELSVPPAYLVFGSLGGTCPSLTHFEGAICISDTRICSSNSLTPIVLGGEQNWIGAGWGSCVPKQASHCASGYSYFSNQCSPANYNAASFLMGGTYQQDNILSGWEAPSYIVFSISVRTQITEISILSSQYSYGGSVGFNIFDSTISQNFGSSELKSVTSFGNYGSPTFVSFLFNQSPVILDPGTYYMGFIMAYSGALFIPQYCGSSFLFVDTQNAPYLSSCTPRLEIKGTATP